MVMVRALVKCFPNNMLRQPGDEFDHTGDINPEIMVALIDEEPTKVPTKTKVKKAAAKSGPKIVDPAEVLGLPNDVKD